METENVSESRPPLFLWVEVNKLWVYLSEGLAEAAV